MDWEALFQSSSKVLRGQFEQARTAIRHRGLKGHVNEEIVAEFLKGMLPTKVGFCAGEAIDSDGRRSRQVDVLAYDVMCAPMVFARGDVRILPIESVYGAIEVKTHLNKQEIEHAFENMKAIKALQRKAYFSNLNQPRAKLYGIPGSNWRTTFFVFAFASDGLETVLGHLERLHQHQPIDQRIDMILVLDKGLIINTSPRGLEPIPGPDTTVIAKPSVNSLLAFYATLSTLLSQTYSEPVDMNQYIKHIVL